MKKLMMVAASMAVGIAFGATACGPTAVVETTGSVCGPTGAITIGTADKCMVWDVALTVKTLAPKKMTCKGDCTTCGEKSTITYLDDATRKIQGYAWICEDFCDAIEGDGLSVVLWEKATKSAVVPVLYYKDSEGYWPVANKFDVWEMYRYGKKATSVAAYWELDCSGVDWGSAASSCLAKFVAAGTKGKGIKEKFVEDAILDEEPSKGCYGLYLKSISGAVVGYWPVTPASVESCDGVYYYEVKKVAMCECFDTWCDVEETFGDDDLIPAWGTWSMKYNKKLSTKGSSMLNLVPSYAIFAE